MAGFSKIKMKNTISFLKGYTEKLASFLKIEVGRNRKRTYVSSFYKNGTRTYNSPLESTGNLRESINSKYSKVRGVLAAYDVVAADYALDIQNGTTEVDLESIERWIRKKPVQLRNSKGQIQKRTDKSIKSAASRIYGKISTEGTKPVPFITEAIDMSSGMLGNIATPFAMDIAENIEDFLNNLGYELVGNKFQLKQK